MDLGICGIVPLVSGANSGIGFAVARQLLAEGALVVLPDQYERELAQAASSIGSPHAAHFAADVTRQADIDALVSANVRVDGGSVASV